MKRFPKQLQTSKRPTGWLDESRLLLAFRKQTDPAGIAEKLRGLKLELEDLREYRGRHEAKGVLHGPRHYWVRTKGLEPISEPLYRQIEKALGDAVQWLGPVYVDPAAPPPLDRFCPFPSVVLIRKTAKLPRGLPKKLGLKLHRLKSKYLTSWDYYNVQNVRTLNAFEIRAKLTSAGIDAAFENMPMYNPMAGVPNDPMFGDQWNMTRIRGPEAWDISKGRNDVVICILDEGCELRHPDLKFSDPGIRLDTMLPTGDWLGAHGTQCAGLAAATINNGLGIAGVAGSCRILPLAFSPISDVQVAAGIAYAAEHGADVLSMSFVFGNADFDAEIRHAFDLGVVMCAAAGNFGGHILYPANHPLVMACGASDREDKRKTRLSLEFITILHEDGSTSRENSATSWESSFGDLDFQGVRTGISVMAPGVNCTTTVVQGLDLPGFPSGYSDFDGTSAATPQVAGLAALLKSRYPQLDNIRIRSVIERTAARVGDLPYADTEGFPHGPRNEEMGHGRIDLFKALDFADVMIRDYDGDAGDEPSSAPGGVFWDSPDIAVHDRQYATDAAFAPAHMQFSSTGDNYIHVRVRNNGPAAARNVVVRIQVAPYAAVRPQHPREWFESGPLNAAPRPIVAQFPNIPAGGSEIAVFRLSREQSEALFSQINEMNWPDRWIPPRFRPRFGYFPTVLAYVSADNDYAFDTSDFSHNDLIGRKNNLAQRNFSFKPRDRRPHILLSEWDKVKRQLFGFIPVVRPPRGATSISLYFDASTLPAAARVLISLRDRSSESGKAAAKPQLKLLGLRGGRITHFEGEQVFELTEARAHIEFESMPGTDYPLAAVAHIPGMSKGTRPALVVYQTGPSGRPIGGVTFRLQPAGS